MKQKKVAYPNSFLHFFLLFIHEAPDEAVLLNKFFKTA